MREPIEGKALLLSIEYGSETAPVMMMTKKNDPVRIGCAKAKAMLNVVEGPTLKVHPASIIQDHEVCSRHLDPAAIATLNTDGPE